MKSRDGSAGSVVRLGELVDYQAGAIVSKILLKTAAGSVTCFAFDQDQGLSEHTVPHDALVYMLDGEADVTVSGVVHHLVEGDGLVMPANQPHALHADTRFKMVLTILHA
jgi:quercetin dioxygenase-like cupin family protein